MHGTGIRIGYGRRCAVSAGSPVRTGAMQIPTFRQVGHVSLPVHFVDSPTLHGRFKCCPDSHSTSVILRRCLAMFCTSATFTATAFPSHCLSQPLPYSFLCPSHILSSHISELAFLPHLPLYPLIPVCSPDWVVPILAHLLP
jgi:hypothetical protein